MNLSKIWDILLKALRGAKITGTLDGVEFDDTSFAGSGKRAFKVKAWVDTSEGPAVQYRASWSDLDDGQLLYQEHPSDNGWQETEEGELRIIPGQGEVSLVGDFTTADGVRHALKLTADIELADIFRSLGD